MVANKPVCSRFEQRNVIKCFLAEKYKPCDIDKRIWDVYGEACFGQKMFPSGVNVDFLLLH